MKTLVYLSDRWGVDSVNTLICSDYEYALNLLTEFNKIMTRFKNLDTETVEYRNVVIPILAKDLQISEQEFVTYLRYGWDMYIQEVNEATCWQGV